MEQLRGKHFSWLTLEIHYTRMWSNGVYYSFGPRRFPRRDRWKRDRLRPFCTPKSLIYGRQIYFLR